MSSPNILILLLLTLLVATAGVRAQPAPPTCQELLTQYLADLDAGRTPTGPLPVPPEVQLRPPPPAGFLVEELRPGVYAVLENTYYSLIALRGGHLVLVDFPAPGGIATNVSGFASVVEAAAVQVLNGTVPRRIDMIYSHSHYDHIGTATLTRDALVARFPRARLRIWASRDAALFIARSGSTRAPLPNVVFRRLAVLRVGGRRSPLRLVLRVVGGHTEDDVLVYIPPGGAGRPGVAFLVDMVVPGWVPPFNFALSQNLREYLAAHDLLLRLDFGAFVGGHLTRVGTRRDVEINRNYTLSVLQAMRDAFATGPNFVEISNQTGVFDPSSPAFGNVFFAFERFAAAVEGLCARAVIEQWGCRLPAVESFARTHCFAARNFLTIDM